MSRAGRQPFSLEAALAEVRAFLPCATPAAWVEAASQHTDVLLIDHANCERKAAATAMSTLFRHDGVPGLAQAMSRLAREELRHFEQVMALIQRRGIRWRSLSASRYAGGLRAAMSQREPLRLLDLLLCGALVEARSCERFAALVPVLDDELARFYQRLLASEARHYLVYMELAAQVVPDAALRAERLDALRVIERDLVLQPDTSLRFHSGPLQGHEQQSGQHGSDDSEVRTGT